MKKQECRVCSEPCARPAHHNPEHFETELQTKAAQLKDVEAEARQLKRLIGAMSDQAPRLGVTSRWIENEVGVSWLTLSRWKTKARAT